MRTVIYNQVEVIGLTQYLLLSFVCIGICCDYYYSGIFKFQLCALGVDVTANHLFGILEIIAPDL